MVCRRPVHRHHGSAAIPALPRMQGQPPGEPKFEVIACIAGRGFGVRREDMKKLLLATGGKVFTLKTMDQLVEHSLLKKFRTQEAESPIAKALD